MTWNPVTGCTKISPGCKHCYAETMARRLQSMGARGYENGFSLTLVPERLEQPLKRKTPTVWFVNSMSDLFHPDIPESFIDQIFSTIDKTPQHIYQILTKRPERMLEYFHDRPVPPHAWLGVTVENRRHGLHRIDILRKLDAKVRFLSIEPLLERLGLVNLTDINWVIVGGESGPRARPMRPEWAREIRDQCIRASVPFFFKQWGAHGEDSIRRSKSANGRLLEGRVHDDMPDQIKQNLDRTLQ